MHGEIGNLQHVCGVFRSVQKGEQVSRVDILQETCQQADIRMPSHGFQQLVDDKLQVVIRRVAS